MTDDSLDDTIDRCEVDRILTACNLPAATWPRQIFDDETEIKKVLADHFLNGPLPSFDGEAGTYSDHKCSLCSPIDVAFPLTEAEEAYHQWLRA